MSNYDPYDDDDELDADDTLSEEELIEEGEYLFFPNGRDYDAENEDGPFGSID